MLRFSSTVYRLACFPCFAIPSSCSVTATSLPDQEQCVAPSHRPIVRFRLDYYNSREQVSGKTGVGQYSIQGQGPGLSAPEKPR